MNSRSPISQMEILDASQSTEWTDVLAECAAHDFYHLPGYHALAERRGEGAARLFVYRDEAGVIALPLLIRALETVPGLEEAGRGWCDANSVYGYPGPIASSALPASESVSGFQSALETSLRGMRVASLFSRLHPLLPQREVVAGLGEYVPSGTTVSIDLTLPLDEQRRRVRGEHRRIAQKAREAGLVVMEDREKKHLARFVEIYLQNMQRVEASGYYFFDRAYFDELLASLGGAARLFVVLAGEDLAAGALFVFTGDIVQYHLSGTALEFLRMGPTKLLLDEVRIATTEEGRKVLHLGGGLGGQRDSLFLFKSGFSDRTHEFAVWRWILDAEKCQALADARTRWSEREGVTLAGGEYFPLYRATATAGTETIL